jgi:predicted phage terminase large subunit-like protein
MAAQELDIRLLPWQEEVWKDKSRFKVVAAGRRTGKTRFAASTLLVRALSLKNGKVFYVAPTQGQARDVIWDMLLELGQGVIVNSHVNNLTLKLINGAVISLKGSDRPETMRGVSLAYVVLDEYADFKPEVWELILRPALADLKGEALFIGTPMGRNHFYELYSEAAAGKLEDYNAWHYSSYDNPLIDPAEIDTAKRTMSSYAFRQEFMASFEAKGSEMFKEEWIQYDTDEPDVGDYYIACDLAGFEEVGKKANKRLDNSSIAVVKVNEHGWWVKEIIIGRWTLDETARRIFDAVQDNSPVAVGIEKGISRQAVMSPLSDLMRRHNKYFRVDELTHGNRKKTDRIMWALQGRFENGLISLNKGEWNIQFMDELFQFPNHLVHDDTIDSLAYIDQLAKVAYTWAYDTDDYEESLDSYSGY